MILMAGKRLKVILRSLLLRIASTLYLAVPSPRLLTSLATTSLAALFLYCLLLLFAFQLVDAVADPGDAELFFGATVGGQFIVGIVVVTLLAFIIFHVRRSTCQWRKTRTNVRESSQSCRDSKWRAVRIFQLFLELRGPNSVW